MPSVNLQISSAGPLLTVHVGVSQARQDALKAAGLPIPAPILCRLLIDTGADGTNICRSVVSQLDLTPTSSIDVLTPSTGNSPVEMPMYDVLIQIPFGGITMTHNAVPVICSEFSAQGIQGLLGRDLLQHGVLVYNGYLELCTLSM